MLIGARFVQGIGGALTSAVILGMIVTMFPEPREQAKAIGVYSFVASAGASIGLLLGGVLTEAINWHWIFFVNLPIGVATALFALRLVELRQGDWAQAGRRRAWRLPGDSRADARRVHDPRGRRLRLGVAAHARPRRACAGCCSAAFVRRQARTLQPLMPLRIFRSRNVTGANLVQMLMVAGLFGMFFLGVLYLQRVVGYGAAETGLAFLPVALDHRDPVAGLLREPQHAVRRESHAAPGARAGGRAACSSSRVRPSTRTT